MTSEVMRPTTPPSIRSNLFNDLLPEGVSVSAVLPDRVVFTGDLDDETVAAVRERMVTVDPAVLAQRAVLGADRDALEDGPLRRAIDYLLGD